LNLTLTNVFVANICNTSGYYKAYYKLLALQYLDDPPKTRGSERVASIFTLAFFGTPQKKPWQ